jgi:hypothetical protein
MTVKNSDGTKIGEHESFFDKVGALTNTTSYSIVFVSDFDQDKAPEFIDVKTEKHFSVKK